MTQTFNDVLATAARRWRPKIVAGGLACAFLLLTSAAHAGEREVIESLMRAHDWTGAETHLTTALRKHPDNALGHYLLAQVKVRQGDSAAAREQILEARRLDPAERFVGNRAAHDRLLGRLDVGVPAARASVGPTLPSAPDTPTLAAIASSSGPVVAIPPETSAPRAQINNRPDSDASEGRSSVLRKSILVAVGLGLLALLALGIALLFGGRSGASGSSRTASGSAVEPIAKALEELLQAERVSDARSDLALEEKLANHDRRVLLTAELQAQRDQIIRKTRANVEADLVRRAGDLAADLRGEERPSVTREREQALNSTRRHELDMANAQRPVIHVDGRSNAYAPTRGYGGVDTVAVPIFVPSFAPNDSRSRSSLDDDNRTPSLSRISNPILPTTSGVDDDPIDLGRSSSGGGFGSDSDSDTTAAAVDTGGAGDSLD